MKKRIIKNWRSSLMGLVLVIIATAAMYTDRIGWTEFLAFLPFALGLIYVQDSIFNPNPDDNG